jgi:hypothetical protein
MMSALELCSQLPLGVTHTGLFVRREKSKGGYPRFYLYNDSEDLELAAECHGAGDLKFHIARGSCNFQPTDNELYLGDVDRAKDGVVYHCRLRAGLDEPVKVMDVRYLTRYQKKANDNSRYILVTQFEGAEESAPLAQLDFAPSFRETFPVQAANYRLSIRNFFLATANGTGHQFSLGKMDEDEFHFAVSGPLSIFKGFCIALTALYNVARET